MPRQPTGRASGRPPSGASKLSKEMRAEFDRLLSENLPAVFAAVVEAATVDKDMAAANLLLARGIPVRRGAVVNFSLRPLKTAEDCAAAYDDLLTAIADGKLTPDKSRLIADIVAKRAELFQNVALEALEVPAVPAADPMLAEDPDVARSAARCRPDRRDRVIVRILAAAQEHVELACGKARHRKVEVDIERRQLREFDLE